MNLSFPYTLASNKVSKLDCPHCGAKSHWQRYIDTQTGEVLPAEYGRCDNEIKCGVWNDPHNDEFSKSKTGYLNSDNKPTKRLPQNSVKKPSSVFIPADILRRTLSAENYDHNRLIQNLLTNVPYPFDVKDVERVVSEYYLGTITHGRMAGAITLPYIDKKNNIRAVQVKQFDGNNHATVNGFLHSLVEKRFLKSNKPLPRWLKNYKDQDLKVSCLFGEHLLPKYPTNPVALVEAPKTALYATLYFGFPNKASDLLWLAVYNKSAFTVDRIKALQGRHVIVFPDLSKDGKTYKEWYEKASEFEERLPAIRFVFSDLLENHAPEEDKYNGYDLADYLIKLDWREFRKESSQSIQAEEPQHDIKPQENDICEKSEKCEPSETNYLFDDLPVKKTVEDWSGEIEELKSYFAKCNLPSESFMFDQSTEITNPDQFIKAHLATLETYNGKENGKPVLQRLRKIKELLSINSNNN